MQCFRWCQVDDEGGQDYKPSGGGRARGFVREPKTWLSFSQATHKKHCNQNIVKMSGEKEATASSAPNPRIFVIPGTTQWFEHMS